MTTSPTTAPKTPMEKENHGNQETPIVNLPSSLKLGTPFLRGTRRHRDHNDYIPSAAKAAKTPFARRRSVRFEDLENSSFSEMESICFPDELPLELFRRETTLREESSTLKITESNDERSQHRAVMSPSFTTISPEKFQNEDNPGKMEDICLPSSLLKTTKSETATPKEESLHSPQTCLKNQTIFDKETTTWDEKELCVNVRGDVDASALELPNRSASEDEFIPPICLNDECLDMDDRNISREMEMSSLSDIIPTGKMENKGEDDFSAMIDAMAADFQKEIAEEQQILRRMSSGNKTDKPQSNLVLSPSLENERVKVLEKELQKEREHKEKLIEAFNDERSLLLSRIKEIESHADLSVRLAREESQRLIEEERSISASARRNLETEKANAVAEASRQAAALIEENRKRESELCARHSDEIEAAKESAREETRRSIEAEFSIQKVALVQSLQKEIFEIETELLETIDELEAAKSAHQVEKDDMQKVIHKLQKELDHERENAREAEFGLQKEVEMFRVQLEHERKAGREQTSTSTEELVARANRAECALAHAESSLDNLRQAALSEKENLQTEVNRLNEQLRLSNQTIDKLRSENDNLQDTIRINTAKIELLEDRTRKLQQRLDSCGEKAFSVDLLQSKQAANGREANAESKAKVIKVNIEDVARFLESKTNRLQVCQEQAEINHVAPLPQKYVAPLPQKPEPPVRISIHSFADPPSTQTELGTSACETFNNDANRNSAFHQPGNPSCVSIPVSDVSQQEYVASLHRGTSKAGKPQFSNIPDDPKALDTFVDKQHVQAATSRDKKGKEKLSALSSVSAGITVVPRQTNSTSSNFENSKAREGQSFKTSAINEEEESSVQVSSLNDLTSSGKESNDQVNSLSYKTKGVSNSSLPSRRKSGLVGPKRSTIPIPSTRSSAISQQSRHPSNVSRVLPGDKGKKPPVPRVAILSKRSATSGQDGRKHPPGKVMTSPARSGRQPALQKPPLASASRNPPEAPSGSCRTRTSISGLPARPSGIARGKTSALPKARRSMLVEAGTSSKGNVSKRTSVIHSQNPSQTARLGTPQVDKSSSSGGRNQRFSLLLKSRTIEKDGDQTYTCTPKVAARLKEIESSRTPTTVSGTPPHDGSELRNSREPPSSEQVRNKFSSLCQVWSTTKTPRGGKMKSAEELPPSLQLNMRLSVEKSEAEIPTQLMDCTKNSLDGGASRTEPLLTPVASRGFSIDDMSSPDDDDLLVSPLPREPTEPKKITEPLAINAIIKVQSIFRTFLSRKRRIEFEKKEKNTLILQKFARYCIAKTDLESRKNSAYCIVRNSRFFLSRRKFRKMSTKMQSAATVIQSHWRCILRVRDYDLLRTSAIVIQTKWRYRKKGQQAVNAVTKIQCFFRRFRAVQSRNQIINSVVMIQAYYRRSLKQRQLGRMQNSILNVQKFYRSRIAQQQYIRAKSAIIRIQRRFRYVHHQKKRSAAAALIQKNWRGFSTRTRFRLRVNYVKVLQSFARTLKKKRIEKTQVMSACATIVQAAWRKARNERFFSRMKAGAIKLQKFARLCMHRKRISAAIAIQSAARCFLAKNGKKRMIRGACTIQARFRGKLARNTLFKKQRAVTSVQSRWRKRKARRQFRMFLRGVLNLQRQCRLVLHRIEQNYAAILIQSIWRKQKARSAFVKAKRMASSVQRIYRTKWQPKLRKQRAVVSIQALIRKSLQRKRFVKLVCALRIVQAHWRKCLVKQSFQSVLLAAKKIQSLVRSRMMVKRRESAVVLIQTHWRMSLAAAKYNAKISSVRLIQRSFRRRTWLRRFRWFRHAVVLLQARVRSISPRKQWRRAKVAAIRIQTRWRIHHLNKNRNTKLLGAVIKLQCTVRRRLAMVNLNVKRKAVVQLQTFYRTTAVSARFRSYRQAAIVLQSMARKMSSMKNFREQKRCILLLQNLARWQSDRRRYTMLRWSTLRIQRAWRRCRENAIRQASAVRLQAWVRLRSARCSYKVKKISITKIQNCYRTHLARNKLYSLKCGIVKIQAAFRSRQAVTRCHRLTRSLIAVQSYLRGQSQRKRFAMMKQATILLQRKWRKYVKATKLRKEAIAVVKLQAWTRARLLTSLYIQQKLSATHIQSIWRAHSVHTDFQAFKQSIIFLQSQYRKVDWERRFIQMRVSTITLQNYVRSRRQYRQFTKVKHAIIILQNQWRRLSATHAFMKKRKAVMMIQKWARGKLAIISLRKKHQAATVVQRNVRSSCQSRKFKQAKHAVILLQNKTRQQLALHEYIKKRKAIMGLQKWARGKLATISLRKRRQATEVVQRNFRSWCQSRRFKRAKHAVILLQSRRRQQFATYEYIKKREAIIGLQKWARATLTTISLRKRRQAATVVQRNFRSWCQSSKFNQAKRVVILLQKEIRQRLATKDYAKKRQATVRLQRWIKKGLVALSFRKLEEAATYLQNYWRAKQYSCRFRLLKRSVEKIQMLFRAKKATKHFIKLRSGAVSIQKTFRSSLERKRYIAWKRGVVRIQKGWRKYQLDLQEKWRLRAVIMMQAWIRVRLALSRFQSMQIAAVRVQNFWRMALASMRFLKFRKAIIQMQSFVRTVQTVKQFESILSSIIRLQCWTRSLHHHRRYCSMKLAAVVLQKQQRLRVELERFQRKQSLMRKLQSCVRSRLVRKSYHKKRLAAIAIQSTWRRKVAIRRKAMVVSGVIALQAAFRARVAEYRFKKILRDIVRLQSLVRAQREVRYFRSYKQSAAMVQSIARMFICSSRMKNITQRTILVQSWCRTHLQVKKYGIIRQSSIRIQSVWRGYSSWSRYTRGSMAVCTLQSLWRTKQLSARYKRYREAATVIQSLYRKKGAEKSFRIMKRRAQVLQQWIRKMLRMKRDKLQRSVIKIQSEWRKMTNKRSLITQRKMIIKLQAAMRKFISRCKFLKLMETVQRADSLTPALATPAPSVKRMPLTSLTSSGGENGKLDRQTFTSVCKAKGRRPLGDISSVFSPARTRGLKRAAGEENDCNATEGSPNQKRQKCDVEQPPTIRFPQPAIMKVVELRAALQELGVAAKDVRKLRKAQLISMLEEIQNI